MTRERHERAWPLLCIAACFVALVVAWPRAWEQVAPFRQADECGSGERESIWVATAAGDPTLGGYSLSQPAPPDNGRRTKPAAAGSASPWSPTLEETLERVSELQMAESAPRLAGRPVDFDWPELEMPEMILPSHGPVLVEPGKGPSPERIGEESTRRLPPLTVRSPDGSLRATDLLPLVDGIVSQCARQKTGDAWHGPWPEPVALLDELETLAWECETGPWAKKVIRQVRRLGALGSQGSEQEILPVVHGLEELDCEADFLLAQVDDDRLATQLRRAQHALTRRLAVWDHVIRAGGLASEVGDPADWDSERLLASLAKVESIVAADPTAGEAWREYLAMDWLEGLFSQPNARDDPRCHLLAEQMLRRLTRPGMTAGQREFVARGPLVELKSELRRWSLEPLDLGGLLWHIEQFEETGASCDARRVAGACLLLGLSEEPEKRELGRHLEILYRNANFRLVLTPELLNRMTPDREPEQQRVNDRVLGRPVYGRSVTSADVSVRMIPDPNRLRMALVIEGLVSSLTESTAGPATFFNDTQSAYLAVKEMEIGLGGLRFEPAEIVVDNRIRLRFLRTTLDPIPLIGAIAHEFAHSQLDKSKPEVNRDVKRKVAARAKRQIDQEADAQLGTLHAEFKARMLDPLVDLSLEPTMIAAQTTQDRMTMRLRLAADEQLAAHTPRPRAPAESVVSCQVHQSALNNAIEQMQLDGGTFTLAEIRRRTADVFNRPEMLEENPGREDVTITFAEQDAVTVRCRDGLVTVCLSIVELSKSPNRWEGFQVRASYRPQTDGPSARLVREGIVHLTAARSIGKQIVLRGIFSKAFSQKHAWPITPKRLAADPRMADLKVTQLVIDDGWIGFALGPAQRTPRPVVAERGRGSVD